MTPEEALAAIRAAALPGKAEGVARYMKVPRIYLGTPLPALNDLTKAWRRALSLDERLSLAETLWKTNIFEAMIAGAKLLTQARIEGDEPVWRLIVSWLADFDSWAIADHACIAGQKRLVAVPARLDEVEGWTRSESMWTRRAALVITLPWTKQDHPRPEELAARERVLGWAAAYVDDREWFIQKAVGWWLRELSKHDPERTSAFLEANGEAMKPFARREAAKYLA